MSLNKTKKLKKHLTEKLNYYESECNKWEGKDINKFIEADGKLMILVEIMDLMDWDLK